MADNTVITPGTGETIRTEDRAGVKTQVVGLDLGVGTGTENLMAGSLPITHAGTATAPGLTSAALSATSFTVLASNTARRGATFYNESNNVVYLAFAATSSITAYTVQIPANGYYEMPAPVYTGLITGIALVASGNVRVTEVT